MPASMQRALPRPNSFSTAYIFVHSFPILLETLKSILKLMVIIKYLLIYHKWAPGGEKRSVKGSKLWCVQSWSKAIENEIQEVEPLKNLDCKQISGRGDNKEDCEKRHTLRAKYWEGYSTFYWAVLDDRRYSPLLQTWRDVWTKHA